MGFLVCSFTNRDRRGTVLQHLFLSVLVCGRVISDAQPWFYSQGIACFP